jgi:hypothetical protein
LSAVPISQVEMEHLENMKRTKDDIEMLCAELKYDEEQINTLH